MESGAGNNKGFAYAGDHRRDHVDRGQRRDHRSGRTRSRAGRSCSCIPASASIRRAGARRARQGRPRDRAVASGLRHLATAEGHDHASTISSYFYLDLLEQLDLRDVLVVGVVARRLDRRRDRGEESTARLSRLVMANAVGIKIGDRETRDIVDILALTETSSTSSPISIRRPASATTRRCRRRSRSPPRATARPMRALCLVALHAQSQAQGPAASHPRADAVAVGRGRPHR